jgi:hypothetical protein
VSGVYTGYMCECCWNSAFNGGYGDQGATYRLRLKEHEERGCSCTKPGQQGAKRRAGQWWNDEKQCDERPGVAELERAAMEKEQKL